MKKWVEERCDQALQSKQKMRRRREGIAFIHSFIHSFIEQPSRSTSQTSEVLRGEGGNLRESNLFSY